MCMPLIFFFFLKLMVWMTRCLPHFSPKKDNVSSIIAYNPTITVFRKTRLLFFQLILIEKNLGNTLETLFSQSMASKNIKNSSKTHNQLKTKNLSELRFGFLVFLMVKKILNLNSLHQIKLFDIKINFFGGWNRCQRKISF